MKTTLILILMVLVWSCKPKTEETVISVIEGWPTENVADHKDKDIEIYRVVPDSLLPSKAAYVFVTYRKKDDQLIEPRTGFMYGSDNIYEKVSYKWINDTVLTYKLFNSSDTLTESFTYTINGENSSTHSRVTKTTK